MSRACTRRAFQSTPSTVGAETRASSRWARFRLARPEPSPIQGNVGGPKNRRAIRRLAQRHHLTRSHAANQHLTSEQGVSLPTWVAPFTRDEGVVLIFGCPYLKSDGSCP